MTTTFTDPVCGMEINQANAGASIEYDGQMYYFCSVSCRDMFMDDPQQFLIDQDEEEYRR